MERMVLPGRPHPLGATWDGTGVNFALYSENATRVELCLYDNRTRRESGRILVQEQTAFVWHCYIPGLQPGQLYGYRVDGPWQPEKGLRFNPANVPFVLDTTPPASVNVQTELDPTQNPSGVVLQGVTVP